MLYVLMHNIQNYTFTLIGLSTKKKNLMGMIPELSLPVIVNIKQSHKVRWLIHFQGLISSSYIVDEVTGMYA